MENLLPILLIGLFVYLIFFRRGGMGMGCCGGHGEHHPENRKEGPEREGGSTKSGTVDLSKDEFSVSKKSS
jgi:hypothetical protein